MVECLLAWIMLFVGIGTGNPLYLIASGVFAIAARIGNLKNESEWGKWKN